ncbi:MAG: UDP-N-acetylmuramoyl-L-alanyl-D-glutamate--2,6-diaminopimelate ligase [Candidatus Omnitrophica bacterium]|nr:UDP-N-acetylmuramoyl-L-alanyl-D-glutamate--2,6-diaminopimelate ligase [Candidatus Omnitrophota bacterium]
MKAEELLEGLKLKTVENSYAGKIKGISVDSRRVRPGYLFVAIKGEKLDGHDFVRQAIENGAKAVIMQKNIALKKRTMKIWVDDTQSALAHVCASFFGHPQQKLKVVGITGTNGKTTVSYLIEKILACAGRRSGIIGTVNYRMGDKEYQAINTTPQADVLYPLLQEIVRSKSKYAIMEVSSHALAQGRIRGIDFSHAIFTNLSREHLDYHRDIYNYFSCKSSLFERLSGDAWSIINTDDPYGRRLIGKTKARVLCFGTQSPAQIRAEKVKLNLKGSQFRASTPKGNFNISTPLVGSHNVYNILAAISFAFTENIDRRQIVSALESFEGVPGRLERVDCGEDFFVFVDYAHTDAALEVVLRSIRKVCKKNIILVFGCGGNRDKTKRPRMGRLACKFADSVIITSDNPRQEDPQSIVRDIKKGISKKARNYEVIIDRYDAIVQALNLAGKQDVVIIAGKGHESQQIFAQRTIFFNDRKAVEEIITCLRSGK